MMLYLPLAVAAVAVALAVAFPLLREEALPPARRKILAGVLLVFVIASSAALYAFLGAGGWVGAIQEQRAEQASLRVRISGFNQRSHIHPDDAENWRALGQAWVEAAEFSHAAEAWRRAVLASGGNPDIIAEYAAALVMQNDGTVGEDAVNSIGMALKLNLQQPLARELEILRHQQQSEGSGAVIKF